LLTINNGSALLGLDMMMSLKIMELRGLGLLRKNNSVILNAAERRFRIPWR